MEQQGHIPARASSRAPDQLPLGASDTFSRCWDGNPGPPSGDTPVHVSGVDVTWAR